MITVDHAIEIALLLLVAYLAGCVLGYLAHLAFRAYKARPRFEAGKQAPATVSPVAVESVRVDRTPAAVPVAAPVPAGRSAARRLAGAVEREDAKPAAKAAGPSQQRPPDLPAPRGGKADDLRKIKGIGAKTESALNDLGIYHLDQIAAWTVAHVDWLEGRIAVKGRIRREQWVEQAVLILTETSPA